MTESQPPKKPTKRKASATKSQPAPASKPSAAAPKAVSPPAAQPNAPTLPGAQPDEAPIPPRNRHERRSAGKKRPGQAPFKWPPIGPERP